MPRVVADNDVKGQLGHALRLLASAGWGELFSDLNVVVETFESLGLSPDAKDHEVWEKCQGEGVVLFTGNRSGDGSDSLELTIRQHNQSSSLPVITLGDAQRFNRDRDYAERAAVRMLEYLLDLDAYSGAGRLYVP